LTDIGVEGAIVGKALYAGAFTLQEAIELAYGVNKSLEN
jgi:phosphoribosylformimino-5-aminoimidazole carboxamide ribonucleotide (ProFAR) isomerase